ncbi:MAG: excinuclease ABC subunit A [Granulosicoccus sp.]|jgi:excinuclease ABC subunit A
MSKKKSGLVAQPYLEVNGARVHNLKNIDVKIPRYKLVVITGLSGSGKSSLAFDTIYAEGQRRYIETFSAYARQFMGNLERPDVDNITGLSPVISIEQKSTNRSPRSTVGTITEIYDLFRLLYARASIAYSYNTGERMIKHTDDDMLQILKEEFEDKRIILMAPVIKGRKGHYRDLFDQFRRQGFQRVRVDGELRELDSEIKLDRYKVHDIELVTDRIKVDENNHKRLRDSLNLAMKHGKGSVLIQNHETAETRFLSRALMCPTSGIAYDEPQPNLFSFNSPYGACPTCNGLGNVSEIDREKIIPKTTLSIARGGIAPLGEQKNTWIFHQLEAIGDKYDFKLNTPIKDISEEALNVILHGSNEVFKVKQSDGSASSNVSLSFEGIMSFISRQATMSDSARLEKWAKGFTSRKECDRCNGDRLKKESLFFKVANKNIAKVARMDLQSLAEWLETVEEKMDERQLLIGHEILKEIRTRLQFLLDVGLEYLALDRPSRSLSGGEAQRIRLATQIGSELVGVLYILDEPSIGLHQRDNQRLIKALQKLRDTGNSVIVVEHDKDMMMAADQVIDLGPGAGIHGGELVGQDVASALPHERSLTAGYLSGAMSIPFRKKPRKGTGKFLTLKGATGNNLKNVDLKLPLGKMICVTGVSGSGKSSLINSTLHPVLSNELHRAERQFLPYKKLVGLENLDKVIGIDQTPIGRTPRSNPATYTGVFSDIRALFASLPEAQIRGYKAGRFSFNVKGGRCEECRGAGIRTIEMNFLPDVHVHCTTCNGRRFNRETLEVRFKGKSVSDVLDMNISEAMLFFKGVPSILRKISTINDVGLGYISLGQSSTTLSGGEAQRIKLASELSKKDTGQTLYILDEPTTGLHFEDVRVLLGVLDKLADRGNTVLIIEHNMDVIRSADYIIDIGKEGGERGGEIIAQGSPLKLATETDSYTGVFLKEEFDSLGIKV